MHTHKTGGNVEASQHHALHCAVGPPACRPCVCLSPSAPPPGVSYILLLQVRCVRVRLCDPSKTKKHRTVNGDVAAMVRAARAAASARGGGHVYVDGGTLCRAVLDAGLVVCM